MERTESLEVVEGVAQDVEVLDVANVRWDACWDAKYFLKCLDRRGRRRCWLCVVVFALVFALVFFLPVVTPFVTPCASVAAAPWAKRQALPKLHRPAK